MLDRFLDSTIPEPNSGCWIWLGGRTRNGYGAFYPNPGNQVYAHRFSWEAHKGAIPPDKPLILHHCDNKSCVNPDHLYAGTYQDNSNDALRRYRIRRGKSHGNAKLTEAAVRDIRSRRLLMKDFAKLYGVSFTTIYYATVERTWSHV